MFSWNATCNSFACWWWIIPLVLMALCMIMCITSRHTGQAGDGAAAAGIAQMTLMN